MVAIGALVGLWVFGRELARSGLPAPAVDAAMAGVVGGLLGAKFLWVAEHVSEAPFTQLLFSRGGMSWFGGLVGGIGTGLLVMWWRRIPIVAALAAATPALAIGHAIGRIGCFLVGDDYGRPSDLPWAVAFPRGLPPTDVPVHPTQMYEAFALAVVALFLVRWRRRHVADSIVLGRYLVRAGAIRFAIEFIRINVRIVGPYRGTVHGRASRVARPGDRRRRLDARRRACHPRSRWIVSPRPCRLARRQSIGPCVP